MHFIVLSRSATMRTRMQQIHSAEIEKKGNVNIVYGPRFDVLC